MACSPSPEAEAGRRHVVLFRAAKTDDAYQKALEQGFIVHFVKALHFEHVNSEELASALYRQHGGLILTSQTAVESISHAISLAGGELSDVIKRWNDVPVFVVGKATAAAVSRLGLRSTGAASGNAELLAEEIIKFYSAEDGSSVPPLLFPCGNLARDTLPRVLQAAGLRVSSVHCYTTSSDPGIEPHLHSLRQQGVLTHQSWVVFFSPSGVQFVLPLLQAQCSVDTLKVAAIGPTTAVALQSAGLSPVVAHTPSPHALLDVLQ